LHTPAAHTHPPTPTPHTHTHTHTHTPGEAVSTDDGRGAGTDRKVPGGNKPQAHRLLSPLCSTSAQSLPLHPLQFKRRCLDTKAIQSICKAAGGAFFQPFSPLSFTAHFCSRLQSHCCPTTSNSCVTRFARLLCCLFFLIAIPALTFCARHTDREAARHQSAGGGEAGAADRAGRQPVQQALHTRPRGTSLVAVAAVSPLTCLLSQDMKL
jgi:hypothetical protein